MTDSPCYRQIRPVLHDRFALFFLHVSHYIRLKNPLQVLIFSGFKRFFRVFYITPKLRFLFPIHIQCDSKTASSSSKKTLCSKIASSSARKSSFFQILAFALRNCVNSHYFCYSTKGAPFLRLLLLKRQLLSLKKRIATPKQNGLVLFLRRKSDTIRSFQRFASPLNKIK